MKVTKFGGTSLASASQIQKVISIIKSDSTRQIVVASAPGKRFSTDIKVTDLLLALNANKKDEKIIEDIVNRFQELIYELNLNGELLKEIKEYFYSLDEEVTSSELISRGEYFSSKILAASLGYKFIDAKDFLIFDNNDKINFEKSKKAFFLLYKEGDNIVVPGFYGKDKKGNIHLFSRGGSDITGSYVAAFVNASLYENWTDVSGVFSVNPSIVKSATTISNISYEEIRQLSYMGANVLHTDSIIPCQERDIPIYILNTNHPEDGGTLISSSSETTKTITGIAGRSGFVSFTLSKRNIQSDVNSLYRVLHVFDEFHVLIENIASGIDTLTITCTEQSISLNIEEIKLELEHRLNTKVQIDSNLSLVSIVSKNLEGKFDVISRIFEILKNNQIQTRLIDHSNDDTSIIIGVDDFKLSETISSLYDGLFSLSLI